MPVIYLDVLLAVNLLIDFLLLSATAYLLHIPVRRWRLVVAAVAGAASATLILLPPLPTLASLGIKLALAACLVRIAFAWNGLARFIKQCWLFFVVSVVFVGVAFGLWTAFSPRGMTVVNGVVYYDVPPGLLVLFSVISYLLLRLYDRITRKKAPRQQIYRLRIDGGAGMVELNALYDTGHHITEQFSGSPVVIVQWHELAGCLPVNLQQSLQRLLDGQPDDLSAHAALKNRLRLIPIHTMGGDGCLPAFRPVGMTVSDGTHTVGIDGAYIAVSHELKSREYQALFGNDIAELLISSQGGHTHEPICRA